MIYDTIVCILFALTNATSLKENNRFAMANVRSSTPDEMKNGVRIHVDNILFSQNDVSEKFTNADYTILDNIWEFFEEPESIDTMKPMGVIPSKRNGFYYVIDGNRRLYTYKTLCSLAKETSDSYKEEKFCQHEVYVMEYKEGEHAQYFDGRGDGSKVQRIRGDPLFDQELKIMKRAIKSQESRRSSSFSTTASTTYGNRLSSRNGTSEMEDFNDQRSNSSSEECHQRMSASPEFKKSNNATFTRRLVAMYNFEPRLEEVKFEEYCFENDYESQREKAQAFRDIQKERSKKL